MYTVTTPVPPDSNHNNVTLIPISGRFFSGFISWMFFLLEGSMGGLLPGEMAVANGMIARWEICGPLTSSMSRQVAEE